jgi:hypothetical protein
MLAACIAAVLVVAWWMDERAMRSAERKREVTLAMLLGRWP